jgi:hypothetical protein
MKQRETMSFYFTVQEDWYNNNNKKMKLFRQMKFL